MGSDIKQIVKGTKQICGTVKDSYIKKRFEDPICFTFCLSTYDYMYPTCKIFKKMLPCDVAAGAKSG